ncbi:hypothetical protein [Aestuariimicrobium sp. Y1814]|uniref:hypothetical protein n=1 Tax=Aestuariimicrobium sp. Y1814 TaxID=3418742 RepID=UPI003DA6FF52
MAEMPASERVMRAQIAASTRWAKEPDRAQATKPARQGLRRKFEREADPEGKLPQAELDYRVDQLMKAHMLRMTLAASKARREKRAKS